MGDWASARLSMVQLRTQTQVSGTPHISCHLLKCLMMVAFWRFCEPQSKPLLGQDKPVGETRGDETRLLVLEERAAGLLLSPGSMKNQNKPSEVKEHEKHPQASLTG